MIERNNNILLPINLQDFNQNKEHYEDAARKQNQLIIQMDDKIYIVDRNNSKNLKPQQIKELSKLLSENSYLDINIVSTIPNQRKNGIYMVIDNNKDDNTQSTNMLRVLRIFLSHFTQEKQKLRFNATDENTEHLPVMIYMSIVYRLFEDEKYELILYNIKFSNKESKKENSKKIVNAFDDIDDIELMSNRRARRHAYKYLISIEDEFEDKNDESYNENIEIIDSMAYRYAIGFQKNNKIIPDLKRLYSDNQKEIFRKKYIELNKEERNKIFPSAWNSIPLLGKYMTSMLNKKKIDEAFKQKEKKERKNAALKDEAFLKQEKKEIDQAYEENLFMDHLEEIDNNQIDNVIEELDKEEESDHYYDEDKINNDFNKNLDESINFENIQTDNKNNNFIHLKFDDYYFKGNPDFNGDFKINNLHKADVKKKKPETEKKNFAHDEIKKPTLSSMPTPPRRTSNIHIAINNQQPSQQLRKDTGTTKTKDKEKSRPNKTPKPQNIQEQNMEKLNFAKKTPEPKINYLILIILFILGILPSLIYYFNKKNEQETWRKANNNSATIKSKNRPQL